MEKTHIFMITFFYWLAKMEKGFELLDNYTRNNIVLYLDSNGIESFSQLSKDCAYSCALMNCRMYAECIVNNQSVQLEVISFFRKVVRVEEVKELSILIVNKIFEISGSVLLRKTHQLPPLLMELMTGYLIDNLDYSRIFETCHDIPIQIVQHIIQCCVTNNYLYTKKSFDHESKEVVAHSKEDVVATLIRNRAHIYCLMTSLDTQFNHGQHKFIIACYEDLFLSPRDLNLMRILIKSIFDTTIDEIELVIDVGQLQYFPDNLNFNYIRWDTNLNSDGGFPVSMTRISIIGDRLTTVGSDFLSGCTNLIAVILPYSVTSIGDRFLSGCSSLTSVIISDNIKSIGDQFLSRCTSLITVNIPNSVTYIGIGLLFECTSLSSIAIPLSVTSIESRFLFRCSSLTSLTIPDSVTSIGYHFLYECTGLITVTVPDSVLSIGDGFLYDCTSLTSLTIPNSATSIGYGFLFRCSSLSTMTIPNSVTSIGGSFLSGCTSLTSVTIPDSISSIEHHFLSDCTSLTTVTIPNSVTSIGSHFLHQCTSLTSVTFLGSYRPQFEELINGLQSRGIRVVSEDGN